MHTWLVLVMLFARFSTAQEDHSQHQHAVAGLGTVDFPTSCNPAAQALFSRTTALLHSFGYEEARLAFTNAAKADPLWAMPWWGIARTWYHRSGLRHRPTNSNRVPELLPKP